MAQALAFAADVVALRLLPLLLGLGLAWLIQGKLHALLIVINLWLFTEIMATLFEPGYVFATLLGPRLVASALQVALGFGFVLLWRFWRVGTERVTVH
jgi:hypothetical protein